MGTAIDSTMEQCGEVLSLSCFKRCNILPSQCVIERYFSCRYFCKCDWECVYYGDCCIDYWHYCERNQTLNTNDILSSNNEVAFSWDFHTSKLVGSVQKKINAMNNSISSFVKSYIRKLNQKKDDRPLATYASCTLLSAFKEWHFYVISKCPLGVGINYSPEVKEKCEDPKIKSLAPVFKVKFGLFRNQHCVKCHGFDVALFKQIPLSFMCRKQCFINMADVLIEFGEFKRVRDMLHQKCSFHFEVINDNLLHGTPGLPELWMKRLSCMGHKMGDVPQNGDCNKCPIPCDSFLLPIFPQKKNPFVDGCLYNQTECKPHQSISEKLSLPHYTLFYPSNDETAKIKTFIGDTKYDYITTCDETGQLDIIKNECIDLNQTHIIENDDEFYHPLVEDVGDILAVPVLVDPDNEYDYLTDPEKLEEYPDFTSFISCSNIIQQNIYKRYLSNQTYYRSEFLCMVTDLFSHFENAKSNSIQFLERLGEFPFDIVLFTANANVDKDLCHDEDEIMFYDAKVLIISGVLKLLVDINNGNNDHNLMFQLNESVIIAHISLLPIDNDHSDIYDMSLSMILCKRSRLNQMDTQKSLQFYNFFALASVCNSTSLLFLTILIIWSSFAKRKTWFSNSIIMWHLVVALFFSQLTFQVRVFNHISFTD